MPNETKRKWSLKGCNQCWQKAEVANSENGSFVCDCGNVLSRNPDNMVWAVEIWASQASKQVVAEEVLGGHVYAFGGA